MIRDAVLLLGGSGFIGTALSTALAKQGRRVHVISRTPLVHVRSNVVHHRGSIDDLALLEKLQPCCDTVVHLASTSTPGSSARHPAQELHNLSPTLRVLETVREWPGTHLVYLSSGGTVYGNPSHNPVAEDAPLAPRSYHGAGKVALEGFLQAYRSPAHPVTILRPSNAYGPGQGLRHGFGLVRTVLEHALHGTTVEVWGDGKTVRDYIFIDDVVGAIIAAIDARTDNHTYNVGSGIGHSVTSLIATIRAVTAVPLPVCYRPARGIDVQEVVLDTSRVRAAFGWQADVGLEAGIARTWQHLQGKAGLA